LALQYRVLLKKTCCPEWESSENEELQRTAQ